MKRLSNSEHVINLAKNSPDGFTVNDVKKQIKGILPNSLYALMWKLKRDRWLNHDRVTGKYVLASDIERLSPKSTPVNKTEKKPEPLPPKGSNEREVRELGYQVHGLKNQVARLEGQYTDALAIIRYLEDKLFKAIQFDARNGGNS